MENYKQADSLRGILALFVVAAHWLPHSTLLSESGIVFSAIKLIGEAGMYFFFVLSGFLITSILILNQYTALANGVTRSTILINFYIRRALRLWPIYFVVLIFLYVFNISWFREIAHWHISYLSNIYFYKIDSWKIGGHLWSLSSEEQFYIFWPLLILFVPKKYLSTVLILILLTAPVFRMLMNFIYPSNFTQILTPAVFDGFALGGLLSIWRHHPDYKKSASIITRYANLIGVIGVVLIMLFHFKPFGLIIWNNLHPIHSLFYRTSFALVGTYVVWGCVRRFGGYWPIFLENRFSLFLGKISYSIYLIHNFQLDAFDWFSKYYVLKIPTTGYYLILQVLLLFIFSTLSWYIIELPINNLKRYFTYQGRKYNQKVITRL